MDHRLVRGIESALGWPDSRPLGSAFTYGRLPDPSVCGRLLTASKLLDIIMRRSLTYPQLRCLQAGKDLPPSGYLTTVTTGRGQSIQVADMRRLGHLLQEGCTLILDDVGPLDATLEIGCRALQWWAGELTRVNTYLTTQDAGGFGLHWDSHDVIVVQRAGNKSWEVRGLSRPVPMERDVQPNTEPSTDIVWSGTMQAGDVMHIPRGHWHQATRTGSGTGFSLHATFGLTQRTGIHWLTWLADQARANELFRHDLNRHATQDHRDAAERELANAAAQLATANPPSEYRAARAQQRPSPRHVTTFGLFGQHTAVACVTEFPPRLETHGDKVVLLAANKKITLARPALPALRLLLRGSPVEIAQATRAAGIDATSLAETLVAAGICAELTPELAAGYASLLTAEAR